MDNPCEGKNKFEHATANEIIGAESLTKLVPRVNTRYRSISATGPVPYEAEKKYIKRILWAKFCGRNS